MGIIDELKKKGFAPKGKIGITYTSRRDGNGASASDLPYEQAIIELTKRARDIEGVRIETTGGITFYYGKNLKGENWLLYQVCVSPETMFANGGEKNLQLIPEVRSIPIYPPSERPPNSEYNLVRKRL